MYELRFPAPPLAPYIESYWFLRASEGDQVSLTVDVFVDLRADLVFNFGAGYERTVHGAPTRTITESNLDAQRLRPIKIRQQGEVRIAGVRFHTAGLAPFVAHPVCAWNNLVVPLQAAFGEGVNEVQAALDVAGSTDTQAELLDAYLLRRVDVTPQKAAVHTLKTRIEESDGAARMEELCDHAQLSERQVRRLFRDHLGYSPKTFARVVRFQRALNRLRSDPGCTLATVATECGYYDQSHFVRDFKAFAGAIPRERVGFFPVESPTDFSPNVVRFVQDAPGN